MKRELSKTIRALEHVIERLGDVEDAAWEKYEALPESLMETVKGQRINEIIDGLALAADCLDEAMEALKTITGRG